MRDSERLDLPSASSFWLDYRCPGRQNVLNQITLDGVKVVEDPELAEYSKSGQRIHRARETGSLMELSEDELTTYKRGVDAEQTIVQQWQADKGLEVVRQGQPEARFWYNHPTTLRPLASAQLDQHYICEPYLLVIDWKSFYSPWVPPSNANWQLRLCALTACFEYDGIQEVRVALNKPMAFRDRIDFTDLTSADVRSIEKTVLNTCWASAQPDAPLYPGPHCFRCAAKAFCPAATSYAAMPALTLAPTKPGQTVALMAPKDMAKVWLVKSRINQIFKGLEAQLSQMSDEDLVLIGLRRTNGRALNRIKNVPGAVEKLKRLLILSDEEVYAAMKFTTEPLCELVMAQKSFDEDKAKEWVDSNLNEFIERARSKPSIVGNK